MTINYTFKISSINRLVLYIDENDNTYNNLITKIQGHDNLVNLLQYYQLVEELETAAK